MSTRFDACRPRVGESADDPSAFAASGRGAGAPALALAKESTSKDIVLAARKGYDGNPPVSKANSNLAIELCTDSCDYFVVRKMQAEPEVWDAVLLHQAYFDTSTGGGLVVPLQVLAHISKVMAEYASKCSKYPQDASARFVHHQVRREPQRHHLCDRELQAGHALRSAQRFAEARVEAGQGEVREGQDLTYPGFAPLNAGLYI
jgi:hypothetical protein